MQKKQVETCINEGKKMKTKKMNANVKLKQRIDGGETEWLLLIVF